MPIPLKTPIVLECQNCHFTFKIIGDDLVFPINAQNVARMIGKSRDKP